MGKNHSFKRENELAEAEKSKACDVISTWQRDVHLRKLRRDICRVASEARLEQDNALGILKEDKDTSSDLESSIFERRINALAMPGIDPESKEHVRLPQTSRKMKLSDVVISKKFQLRINRFHAAQRRRTINHPSLPQPPLAGGESIDPFFQKLCSSKEGAADENVVLCTEIKRTSAKHRFVITADTQYGIMMDGYAMNKPNWDKEIKISRACVNKINAMNGENRPKFVIVCGDLVDTHASFSKSLATWKKVMESWERDAIFDQQAKDFKMVWSKIDSDIPLVCLCGNHDVGNRPTPESIDHWKSKFGDDYLAWWVNGTYCIGLNNNLFANPTGAKEMYKDQLKWLEERLIYGNEEGASHIFIFGHYPWFLRKETEKDKHVKSSSSAPNGWGPKGTAFPDSYFTIPLEYRKVAMNLFKKYHVTACFSGHFHQNVVTKSSWGMDMIVTGPLSMTLSSSIQSDLSDEKHGVGMRIVDVFADEKGKFTHEWKLLDEDKPFMDGASMMQRVSMMQRASMIKSVSMMQRFRRSLSALRLTKKSRKKSFEASS